MSSPEERFRNVVPPGDDRVRRVCGDCGFIDYQNPKVVVGVLATWQDKILLCQRAIEPRSGFWTHPSGHLERGESTEEGALRECWEEARARVDLVSLLGVYTNREYGVVEIVYRARLDRPVFEPGPESRDVVLLGLDDLETVELAFPTTQWAIELAFPQLHTRAASA